MAPFIVRFDEAVPDGLGLVGGKAANLGILTRAGLPVPGGFTVTTVAYESFLAALPDRESRFAALDGLDGRSVEEARSVAGSMRAALDTLPVPDEATRAIVDAWRTLGPAHALAVRSSATAEDIPGASFAGQQDTYLNVIGEPALLDAVRRCWISLFTDRAVIYRARGGFGHRSVRLAVVVQHLVDPEVSGIMFTADPVSGNRHVTSIDAGFGLSEALVCGLVSADLYQVDRCTQNVTVARPAEKDFAIRTAATGGTVRVPLHGEGRHARSLDDRQVLALAALGDRIEALYQGEPQDIEWCFAGGEPHILQARPITSLFPVPRATRCGEPLRIFLSFGHFQMMLDAMPRLSREVWRLFFPPGKRELPAPGSAPEMSPGMIEAGSRLYVDATEVLRIPALRSRILGGLTHIYEALGRGAALLAERPAFRDAPATPRAVLAGALAIVGPILGRLPCFMIVRDPRAGAEDFDVAIHEIPRGARDRIDVAKRPAERIRRCASELNAVFFRVRRHLPSLLSGVLAHVALGRLARGRWADDVRSEVDALMRGLPGNVTTRMDLAVGDLTDVVRPHPELAGLLRDRPWREVKATLGSVGGGSDFHQALEKFLAEYGHRGASEIDVSRPRWCDDPSLLLRVITGGLHASGPGAHRRQHAAQVAAGEAASDKLVTAARRGPMGFLRGVLVRRLVFVARTGLGLREHPKFMLVSLLGHVRREILGAAAIMHENKQIDNIQDVWHLGFEELAAALEDPERRPLQERLASRAADFRHDQGRKPPLVLSSEGEAPAVPFDRADLPAGALAGTAASAGVVEGLARVVTDPASEVLLAGEILVAPFTDPGWTPLFVNAAAVVTEVGGLMTHGAVVAREYGIPAVVSVASAVERIRTGQRLRVDGTRGFVLILEDTDRGLPPDGRL